MLKRSIWLILGLVTAFGVLVGWGQISQLPSQTAPLAERAVMGPQVDGQRLVADLQALTYERFTEDERDRARRYIVEALKQAGWTPQVQRFEGTTNQDIPTQGINIYAERLGTDPQAGTILLAGHYDTVERSPGADDNATSVATVLETARLLGQVATPRTLQLALFDLEEVGLVGSKAFVEQVVQPDRLRGAIILDMLGYRCLEAGCQSYPPLPIDPPSDRGDFLAVLVDQGHRSLLNSFTPPATSPVDLPPVFTLAIPTFGGLAPDMVRSDHAPFWDRGLGAALVTDTANFRNPHYHQSSDTLETIDPEFFLGAAQIVVNAIASLLGVVS